MSVLGVVFWTAVRCAAVAAAREVKHAVSTARTIKVTLTARTAPGQMGVSVDLETDQADPKANSTFTTDEPRNCDMVR